MILRSLFISLAIILTTFVTQGKTIDHYVFYGMDREKLVKDQMLDDPFFKGAQVAYFWKQLEPVKDEYDFSLIREDLNFLRSKGKRLWIQLQDVTFNDRWVAVPKYIQNPKYNGGIGRQYIIPGEDESKAVPRGSATRRWDPAVQERLHKLFEKLASEFDGQIEGINLAETSVGFGHTGKLYPTGYTPEVYRDSMISNMKALKKAFRRSVAMIYANFMPGEWRPTNNKGYLESIYKAAAENGIAVGGPDLFPFRPGQLGSSYPLIKQVSQKVKAGIAVQDGNYAEPDPKTGKPIAITELTKFATEYLNVDYIFWCTEEPFYSRDLAAHIRQMKKRL
jgi:hypothetical protein